MSLDKSIAHGKERRKQYRGSKAIDKSCRNHGGCDWCLENRMYKNLKRLAVMKERMSMRMIADENGYPIEPKREVYCMDCRHALIDVYNEWIDVYCVKHGKVSKTSGLLDTCEDGEWRTDEAQ